MTPLQLATYAFQLLYSFEIEIGSDTFIHRICCGTFT